MDKELEERLVAYRKEARELWLKMVPALALTCGAIVFGMMWGVVQLTGSQPLNMDWRFVAAIMSIALMIPPIKMMYPERPTQSSVEHDRVLNEIGRRLSARRPD